MSWKSVVSFYLLACAISWPIFWIRDSQPRTWESWSLPLWFNKGWLPALGPFLAGIVFLCLCRNRTGRRVSVLGSSLPRSILFIAIPGALLTAVGVGSDEPHLTGLILALSYVMYGFLEETGWRGFLQGALLPLRESRRYVLIGVLWGVWHFTTFASGTPGEVLRREALMAVLWIAGSWGIGVAVERTRSLSVAAMLHLIFNFSRALPGGKALVVLGVSGAAWFLLLRGWPAPPDSLDDPGTSA